jgi:hypothetical protein
MKYTADQLLKVLESYSRMIERDRGQYPAVVLDDIHKSIISVLKENKKQ